MAKRKAAKQGTTGESANDAVEPMVVALAEQLGAFLGRVQRKADGWLENETLRQQVTQIRDGAASLLKQVGKAEKSEAKAKGKRRSVGAAPDAPSRRLRKPPPHELFDPRLGEPMGKQMGQKSLKRRGRG